MANVHNFCCVCLSENEEFESVTEPDANGIKYSEKLFSCDPKQEWDDKTLALCKSCINTLHVVYEFLEQCKKSEDLRREKLNQLYEEFEKRQQDTIENFTCYICKKSFSKKRFLKSHITKIHLPRNERRKRKDCLADGTVKEENKSIDSSLLLTVNPKDSSCKFEKQALNFKCDEDENDNGDYFHQNDSPGYSSDEEKKPKPKRERKKRLKRAPDSFTCEYCGKQFNRRQHWSAHIRAKHTFEKPYQCNLCEASFTSSHSLLIHKRNHNNEKPYICSTCGKGFVCSGDLIHHNKIHLNKKEYECNFCNKRFNTTSILRTHKIVKHMQPEDWKYACTLCERRFPINSSLSVHMKRHIGVKDHPCHICGKLFFSNSEVAKHILCHSNEKKFKCDLCENKEYKNKEGLNKHLKVVHDMGTWKPPKLEKKFLCPTCPKKFFFNNKLQRHMLTHTGEKPYRCKFCDKKFSDIYYRKSHIRKEHGQEPEEEENEYKYKVVEVVGQLPPTEFTNV